MIEYYRGYQIPEAVADVSYVRFLGTVSVGIMH